MEGMAVEREVNKVLPQFVADVKKPNRIIIWKYIGERAKELPALNKYLYVFEILFEKDANPNLGTNDYDSIPGDPA